VRQRTITGPLILILIGGAFLLRNLRPELFNWGMIGDYWPFLLIGFGLIGLVEALFRASRGQPGPAPRPFWILVPFIVIAVLHDRGTFDRARFDAPRFAVFGTDWDYDVNLTTDSAGVKHLVLDGLRGNLSIKGEGGSGQIRIAGHKSIRALSRVEADRADRQSSIRVDHQGDTAFIRADLSGVRDSAQVSGEFDVTIPPGVSVESRTRAGDLTMDEVDGAVDVEAGRGDIRLSHIGGDVRITSSRGGLVHASDVKGGFTLQGRGSDIELITVAGPVNVNGEYSGTLEFRSLASPLRFASARTEFRAEAIPGTVTMDLSDLRLNNVAGPVRFQTSSRDVYATDVTNALDLSVDRGDMEITATRTPLPKIEAHSRNGDIEITLPGNATFDLNATTAQGEAENDYGGGLQTQTEGRRRTVHGKTGGGPQISIATDRGSVSVRKG
jgi:DUF4097 and DUF4098 domain-containing protein YvlB